MAQQTGKWRVEKRRAGQHLREGAERLQALRYCCSKSRRSPPSGVNSSRYSWRMRLPQQAASITFQSWERHKMRNAPLDANHADTRV